MAGPKIEGKIDGDPTSFEDAVDASVRALRSLTNAVKRAAKAVQRPLDKIVAGVKRVGSFVKSLGGAFFKFGKVAAVALAAAVTGIGLLAARGAKILSIQKSFDTLSGSVFRGERLIAKLTKSTEGLVSKTDLQLAANRILAAELPIGDFANLSAAAVKLGRALGINATDAVNRLSLGLSKQEPELLDELGLKVDLAKALTDEAKRRGIAVSALDAQTRLTTFFNAVQEQAIDRSSVLRDTQTDVGAAIGIVASGFKNLIDVISQTIAGSDGVRIAFEKVGEIFNAASDLIGRNAVLIAEVFNVLVNAAGEFFTGLFGNLAVGENSFKAFLTAIISGIKSITPVFRFAGELIGTFNRFLLDLFNDVGGFRGILAGFLETTAVVMRGVAIAFLFLAKPIAGLVAGFGNLIEFATILRNVMKLAALSILKFGAIATQAITQLLRKAIDQVASIAAAFEKLPGAAGKVGVALQIAVGAATAALADLELGALNTERAVSAAFDAISSKVGDSVDIIAQSGAVFDKVSAQVDALAASITSRAAALSTIAGEQFIAGSNAPKFQAGGIVPSTGPAIVHAGEGVLRREAMSALGPVLFSAMNQLKPVNVEMNFGAVDPNKRDTVRDLLPEIQRMFRNATGGSVL